MSSLLTKRKTDTSVVLRLRISRELSAQLKELEARARAAGYDWEISAAAEAWLKREARAAAKQIEKAEKSRDGPGAS